ncbi:protein mono-ADP-ribosyltransferase PARP4 [Alosa pseudoharengus]|uniref:protein mono-ADP-ribosyltransferase PARP4 n=1 Tax=Alosa pseudoharengus TaxID=34774 RepID=UPI003F8B0044
MTVFTNCAVVLELKDLPFKEKKKIRLAITDNGGSLSYVVNKQCSFIVVSSLGSLSNNRQRSAWKHQVPVVGLEYVQACLEQKALLPALEHVLVPVTHPAPTIQPVRLLTAEEKFKGQDPPQIKIVNNQVKEDSNYVYNRRIYCERDRDLPTYPSNFQVSKYSIHSTAAGDGWCVLELQSAIGEKGHVFRVVRYMKQRALERDQLVLCSCSEDALEVYGQLQDRLRADNFQLQRRLPSQHEDMGSPSLKQLLLEEELNCSTLSQEVGVFVELVWTEALGSLTKVLKVPALSISPNDVSRAEGLLLQVRRSEGAAERKVLLEDLHSVLPHTLPHTLPTAKLTSQALDLCQVLKDMLSVNEAVMRSSSPCSVGKYRALGCSIQSLPPQSPDYQTATQLLQHHDKQGEIKIHHVFHVQRGAELQMFREELGNIKPLLHSTSPASFVGILSRGLLLPRVGVEHHGVQRTDVGHLGGGIYFSDSFSTSVKYSRPGVTDGSRLLLVCEVALGYCREFRKKDTTLTSAPEGYDSVHGVRSTPRQHSEFEDDEYVVFSPDQVRLKYVVQYTLPDDQLKDFQPSVDTSVENIPPAGTSDTLGSEDSGVFEDVKNPLDSVTAGLLDSAGQTLPLQAVHVKCKLVDLLSQVIIFQTYSNPNPTPIEAKYVFPLEESAAVCGFEAFINGKHVIGQVKEKEQARKEYKQAIEMGHGAYLMDQEAPDVFTISVGNLPPGATVLIKVTFISELLVKADSIFFQLPGSVAPWQQSAALNERTQGTVEKVCVSELSGVFSLSLSIEMPYEIINLHCDTHRIQTKRTDCKAVVSTLPGETLGSDGFHLYITLSEMHMPRMWVENHPDKDSQACMLVFYPDFGAPHGAGEEPSPGAAGAAGAAGPGGRGVQEVLLLLDCSESMRGEALLNARHIALHLLSKLDKKLKINIVLFGTDHKDAFMFSKVLGDAYEPAKKFIQTSPPVGGSTELWRPLRSLSLLPPSRGSRSLVLLSDGHVQNPTLTLQLVRNNAAHTRLFTCGLSKTANRHMLRALAQAGGGACEFFDTKTRHTWSEKVASQVRRLASPGCSSVAVKWQLFSPAAPPPVQAPAQVHALFSNCHTLVYGFVPHCTQATLYGELCGQEIKTMVSTTELQKTKGTFLHKLTARAVIRDYEDGILHMDEAEHEGKKAQTKSFIVELSKEFSVLSQFTSFVAIEERDAQKSDEGFTDIPKLIAEEDVDLLPYMGWEDEEERLKEEEEDLGYLCGPCSSSSEEEESHDDTMWGPSSSSSKEEDIACSLHMLGSSGRFNAEKIHSDALRVDRSQTRARARPPPRGKGIIDDHAEEEGTPGHADAAPAPPPSNALPLLGFLPSQSIPSGPVFGAQALFYAHGPPPAVGGLSQRASGYAAFGSSSRPVPPPQPFLQQQRRGRMSRAFGRAPFGGAPFGGATFGGATFGGAPCSVGFGFSSASHPPPPPPPTTQGFTLDAEHFVGFGPGVQCPPLGAGPPQGLSFSAGPPQGLSFSAGPPQGLSFSAGPPQGLSFDAGPPQGFGGSGPPPVSDCLFSAPGSVMADLFPPPLSSVTEAATLALAPLPVCGDAHVGPLEEDTGAWRLSKLRSLGVEKAPDSDVAVEGGEVDSAVSVLLPLPADAPDRDDSQASGSRLGGSRRFPPKKRAIEVLRAEDEDLGFDSVAPSPVIFFRQRQGRRFSPSASWEQLACHQSPEGYWECTAEVGLLLGMDLNFFANVFLKEKGISSLGPKAQADILRLVSTLLVLQLVRVRKLVQGELLQSLFRLRDPPQHSSSEWEALKRAVDWVRWADRQYPCVCSRLEFGRDWESSTRQLLGFDRPHPLSPLNPLLERSRTILAC